MYRIILASASPRRRELLKRIVKRFKVVPSRIDESKIKAKTPKEFALKAAFAKALDIAISHKNSVIIGADTIVVLGRTILGKPRDKKHATRMLRKLSGTTHQVITGITVIDTKDFRIIHDLEITKVRMKKVSDKDIKEYVDSGGPMDKAGGYGIQELDEIFIDKIVGDYDNVVGLPVMKLRKLLKTIL